MSEKKQEIIRREIAPLNKDDQRSLENHLEMNKAEERFASHESYLKEQYRGFFNNVEKVLQEKFQRKVTVSDYHALYCQCLLCVTATVLPDNCYFVRREGMSEQIGMENNLTSRRVNFIDQHPGNLSTAKPCRSIMPQAVAPINAAVKNNVRQPLGCRQCGALNMALKTAFPIAVKRAVISFRRQRDFIDNHSYYVSKFVNIFVLFYHQQPKGCCFGKVFVSGYFVPFAYNQLAVFFERTGESA